MSKGYIIPATLVILLLILAGFFVFTPVQSPVVPKQATTTPIVQESTEETEDTATSTDEVLEEEIEITVEATSTESI